jgi:putative ABC transport system permease protein
MLAAPLTTTPMTTSDLFGEIASALTANLARTGLTVLGIVIGIASVIAMVSVGTGAQASIESNITSLGSNLITVTASGGDRRGAVGGGRDSVQTLTLADAEAIAALPGVAAVSPEMSGRYQMSATSGNNTNLSLLGTGAAYLEVHNESLAGGSFLSDEHVESAGKVAVLGATTAVDLFGEGVDPLGETVRINRISFRVIGLLASKGGGGFGSVDEMVFVPVTAMQRHLSNSEFLSTISVSAENPDEMDVVKADLTAELAARHGVTVEEPDFSVRSMDDVLSTMSSVTQTFTLLLACIAGISLVVGGIGIMNMMLTTVTERTREIGLRKALGAKRADISRQFLGEALLMTFIGGAIGLLLGWTAAQLISSFAGITTEVSMQSVGLAVAVCAAIGIVFGYYPAHRAASLKPIVALRHE